MRKILPLVLGMSTIMANAQYDIKWNQTYGNPSEDEYGEQVTTDSSGNLYSSVSFYAAHDIDPNPGNTVNVNAAPAFTTHTYIKKMDSNGDYLDHVVLTSDSQVEIRDMETDASGNLYVTGSFRSDAVFDPVNPIGMLSAVGSNDIFVAKYDGNLDLDWIRHFGNANNDEGRQIELSNNTIYVGGRYTNEIDFDSSSSAGYHTTGSTSFNATFVVSLDYNGNFQNSMDFFRITLNDLESDTAGNFIFTGSGFATVDLDAGTGTVNYTPNNMSFGVICKYNFGFGYEDHFIFDGGLSTQNSMIDAALNENGEVYAVGSTDGSQNLDPGDPSSSVSSNAKFVFKLDNQMDYDWSIDNYGNPFVLDNQDNMYIYGSFGGNYDFDPSPTTDSTVNAVLFDGYLVKLNSVGTFEWVKTFASNSVFVEPGNAVITENNQVFMIGDTDGSVVGLQGGGGATQVVELLFGPACALNDGVLQNGIMLSADQSNVTYQWIDCNTNQPIPGETNQSFTPSTNGNYAVVLTDGTCSDTSVCVNVTTVSINEVFNFNATLYPNPATDVVRITSNELIETVRILDMNGRLVLSTHDSLEIPLHNISKGMYTVEIVSGNKLARTKLLIQ